MGLPEHIARNAPLLQLEVNGLPVAVGSAEQMDTSEAIHRNIKSRFEPDLATKFRDIRDRYIHLAFDLDDLIDLRAQQRTFNNGPCEVCEAWGGL